MSILTQQTSAATDNCKAGGGGYAMAFDAFEGNTISLKWEKEIPTTEFTIEYWFDVLDPVSNFQSYQSHFETLSPKKITD